MALPAIDQSVQNDGTTHAAHDAANSSSDDGHAPNSPSPTESKVPTRHSIIKEYLLERVPEYRRLSALREQGWKLKEGDAHFARQRKTADSSNQTGKSAKHFYVMMQNIAQELHDSTGALKIPCRTAAESSHPAILDMCAAPGGFLEVAMKKNRGACAVAFSLPVPLGGHKLLMPRRNVTVKFLDVTMLAADMGVAEAPALGDGTSTAAAQGLSSDAFAIPANHPDTSNFIRERQLPSTQQFDLVFCDGQVLRTHEPHRAAYRERREATRLTLTQLALGLEHLRPGGTVIVLLHKLEAWDTLMLLRTFDRFTTGSSLQQGETGAEGPGTGLRLFKPLSGHALRSSFYLVATGVRSDSPEAQRAIAHWKQLWRVATFGTDEEWTSAKFGDSSNNGENVETVLEEFGDKLVALGRPVWGIQAQALDNSSFMQNARAAGHAVPSE